MQGSRSIKVIKLLLLLLLLLQTTAWLKSPRFCSLKLHLGMGSEFPVKQQFEPEENFGRRPSLFAFHA